MKKTFFSAALAMSLAVGFTPAKADLSDAALALLPNTTVLDFSNYGDYQIDYASGNWRSYYSGGGLGGGSRHVGYGWSTFYYTGLTRPADQAFSEDYSGILQVTRESGQFHFDAVSLFSYSLGGTGPYEITGWLNGVQMFSTSGPVTTDQSFSIQNPHASTVIDKLEIKLTSLGTPNCISQGGFCASPGDYVGVSNIFVTRAAVPEPGSVALMVAGLAMVGALARRQIKPRNQSALS